MVKIGKLPDDSAAETVAESANGRFAGPQPGDASSAQAAEPAPAPPDRPSGGARLVFASFLMLFVELALIRWVTANNVYVTKATNFVLLASFLGIGIGFLNARTRRD